jgi:Gluconate 2-dehydrogenase subunit 3
VKPLSIQGISVMATRRDMLALGAMLGVALVAPVAGAAQGPTLTKADTTLLGEVAQLIIPATDTGGAKEAGVPAFIVMMVDTWFEARERANFVAGMKAFQAGAVSKYGRRFEQLSDAQRHDYFGALLTAAESKPQAPSVAGSAAGGEMPRSPFVILIKRLTLAGYYTSELGATTELVFDMIPEKHEGCATMSPDTRDNSVTLLSFSSLNVY